MSFELFKEVSIKYYDLRKIGAPNFKLDFLPYDKYRLAINNSLDCLVWSLMEGEYTRTILNIYNNFVDNLLKLYLLDKIISEYSEDSQNDLRHEFTRLILSFCLHKPNELRNRIIFCCYQLGFQTNLSKGINNISDLKADKNINFNDFNKECKRFVEYQKLENSLTLVGNKNQDFVDQTSDFRNKNEHKLPPSLEMGYTNLVRTKKGISDDTKMCLFDFGSIVGIEVNSDTNFDDAITYEFGSSPPLRTKDMIPVLFEQGNYMKDAISKYWNLVLEQNEAFNPASKDAIEN